MFKLDDSQLLVVYSRDETTKQVQRRIVRGPCKFMPEPNEWLHEFKWHTQDKLNVGHLISNDQNLFRIITVKPDFFHYYVKEVRTVDDTLITIKLMLIYELVDVVTMVCFFLIIFN